MSEMDEAELENRVGDWTQGIESWHSDQREPVNRSPNAARFRSEDFDLIHALPGEWLLKGVLPRVSLTFVAGPSMAGKSFFVLAIMSALARGERVLRSRSVQSAVLYIAAEGAAGVRKRVEAMRLATGAWDSSMRLISEAPDLGDGDSFHFLSSRIREEAAEFETLGKRLGVVVIDTMSASIPGADENSAKDMSPVLTRLQGLASELQLCVLVVAHVGKDEHRGIRGWSGMLANADGFIRLDKPDADGTRLATVVKVKDGEAGLEAAFRLKKVRLEDDPDGDEVSSCIVEWCDVPDKPRRARRNETDPKRQLILTAFDRLISEGAGTPVFAPGARAGTFGIGRNNLRDMAIKLEFYGSAPEDPLTMERWVGARRKAFDAQVLYLVRDGILRQEDGLIWRLQPSGEGDE